MRDFRHRILRGLIGVSFAIALATSVSPGGTAAQPLGALRELPAVAGSPSAQPQLAVTPDGRVVLSWLEKIGEPSRHAFKYALGDGKGWTAPRTIVERDNFFVNWADVPSVFPRPEGGLVAHWLQKNGEGTYAYDVRLSLSDAEETAWGEDRLPYSDRSQTEHGFASFFAWPGGGTGVIWLDGREMTGEGHGGHGAGAMTLRAARIQPDGRIVADERLDARVCECCPTAAVATARGAVVAYRDRSEREVRDIAVMRLDETGRWHGPTYVHADNWEINACPVNGPALAAQGDRVALAWFTAQGGQPRAMVAFSKDGGATFGPPVRVDDAQTLGRVDAAMLDDGRAVVSWLEFVPGASEVRARIVSPDGSREPAVTITSSTSDRQAGYPRMVRTGRHLVFAWTSPRPTPQVKTALLALP